MLDEEQLIFAFLPHRGWSTVFTEYVLGSLSFFLHLFKSFPVKHSIEGWHQNQDKATSYKAVERDLSKKILEVPPICQSLWEGNMPPSSINISNFNKTKAQLSFWVFLLLSLPICLLHLGSEQEIRA